MSKKKSTYLISVDERLAQGQLHWQRGLRGGLQVHGDKGPGHRWIAGEKQRLALLQWPGESVADWICAQVGSVVANPHDNRAWHAVP